MSRYFLAVLRRPRTKATEKMVITINRKKTNVQRDFKQTVKEKERQTDRQTDRQTVIQTDRKTDRQTNK